MRSIWPNRSVSLLLGSTLAGILPSAAAAQGCEPIRFTVPVNLGGQGEAYLPGRQWRATLAYRNLHSDQFFVGTRENSALAPGGESPVFNIHTFVADLSYSLSDRFRVSLSVPFTTGTISRKWADSLHHSQRATGLGDVGALAEYWLLNPKGHEKGNISVGLGFKAPTGSHTKQSLFYTATGSVQFAADQPIQPGDGGWGITLQGQAFRQIREGIVAYGFGSYMANPRAQTDVVLAPTGPQATAHWSVPDVYQARLGAAFAVWPSQGLTLSLGGRMDGIPMHDLIGGGDSTAVKRTSQILYADPGLSLERGKSSFTLSVPIRMHVNRMKSLYEARFVSGPLSVNGGGFAKYLIFGSYSYRF
jgi:hypothetical protein